LGTVEPKFAPRPPTKLNRPILPDNEIARIRVERLHPRVTQWDYLHLEGLRRELDAVLGRLPPSNHPVLDLFCGTKPYSGLVRSRPVWGIDCDRHFGGADVLGAVPLPFRDGAFAAVICTQALHLVDDPIATIRDMERVLRHDGHAVVTIPHLFIAEGDFERHWSREDLQRLFGDWDDVQIRGIDGPGVALAFMAGRLTMLAARRWRAVRLCYVPIVVIMNGACSLLDWLLRPLHRRFPHSLLLLARPGANRSPT
jgi:SAM-dependent methyltransferase